MPVATSRATIVDVGVPLADADQARAWLQQAGEHHLSDDLAVLNRTLRAHRLVSADPYLNPVSREQAIVARIGYGPGEQVAEGHWTAARELYGSVPRRRRSHALHAHARFAGLLTARGSALVCEELALRTRLDLDQGLHREAALQVLIALDAALAELPGDLAGAALEERLAELRDQRRPVATAAQAALAGPLDAEQVEVVSFTLGRLEAALRARAAATR